MPDGNNYTFERVRVLPYEGDVQGAQGTSLSIDGIGITIGMGDVAKATFLWEQGQ
jgi:hypothetical protein